MVSFEVFVAPALRRMAGRPDHELELVDATAAHDWPSPGRAHAVRPGAAAPTTGDGRTVALVGHQGSHVLGGLASANALAVVPADVTHVAAGDGCAAIPSGSWSATHEPRREVPGLTHVRADGSAHMVDVCAKDVTARSASAAGRVLLSRRRGRGAARRHGAQG